MQLYFLNPPVQRPAKDRLRRAETAVKVFISQVKDYENCRDNRWEVWTRLHGDMAKILSPDALLKFQSHESIHPHITGGSGFNFLDRLAEFYGHPQLETFLRNHVETTCGEPHDLVCQNGNYITVTSMRHLYHLARIKQYYDLLFASPMPFVEIGGGFGNLARMICQYEMCSQYYIIDHPLMHSIQYFFLTEFLAEDDVAILGRDGRCLTGSTSSRVQLVPLFTFEPILKALNGHYTLLSSQALTEIDRAGQETYINVIDPELCYIYGQYNLVWIGSGIRANYQGINNEQLVFDLGEMLHTLDYQFYGYHFEHIGRKRIGRGQ